MVKLSALLALCEGKPVTTGRFLSQKANKPGLWKQILKSRYIQYYSGVIL